MWREEGQMLMLMASLMKRLCLNQDLEHDQSRVNTRADPTYHLTTRIAFTKFSFPEV